MRTFIFLILVLSFFISGAWLMANKDANAPYDIPYLSEASFGDLLWSIDGETDLSNILVGNWDFVYRFTSKTLVVILEGESEYLSDGTFIKYLTSKHYIDKRGEIHTLNNDADLKIVFGGRVSGTWELQSEGNFWVEELTDCKGKTDTNKTSKKISFCKEYSKRHIGGFGELATDFEKYSYAELSKNRIVINGKQFDSGATFYLQFTRKE